MVNHIFKHLEARQNYSSRRRSSTPVSVLINVVKSQLSFAPDISHEKGVDTVLRMLNPNNKTTGFCWTLNQLQTTMHLQSVIEDCYYNQDVMMSSKRIKNKPTCWKRETTCLSVSIVTMFTGTSVRSQGI